MQILANKKAEVLSSAYSSTLVVFLLSPKGPTIMLEG
jgi:hypothetical protein